MTGPGAHSFDLPRERPAPRVLAGTALDGSVVSLVVARPTLVVAVKHDCDGCLNFVTLDLAALHGVDVVVVSATADPDGEWREAVRPVLVAPDLLRALDIRWPPFYVLILPDSPRVVCEGVVLGPDQVAGEIASHLT